MSSLLVLTALLGTASAQDDGFDGHGYVQVPSDGDVGDPINLWRPEQQVPGSWGLEALFEYADRSVVLVRGTDDNETETNLLDDSVGVNLGGHFALHERFAAAISMPVWLSTGGVQGDGGPTLGDLRIQAPIGIVTRDPEASGIGISLIPGVRLPTGNVDRLLGDQAAGAEVILAPGWSNDMWELAGNFGAGFGKTQNFENLRPGNHLIAGLSFGFHKEDKYGARIEAWMHPALNESDVSGKGSPGEVALTGRFKITRGLTGTLGAQTAFTAGAGAARLRIFAGVVFNGGKGPLDSDGDGIVDKDDACPMQPETVNNYKDADGCPDMLASLIVNVLDPNNDPLAGIEVMIDGQPVGMTDGAGQLMVSDRMPGTVSVEVRDPSGRTESEAMSAELTEGEMAVEFRQIWRPGTIMVMARDGSGDPIDAAISWTGEPGAGEGMLGTDGNEILVLGPGEWDVFARADGFRPERRSVSLAPNEHALEIIELSMLPATTVVTETSIVILEAINFELDSAEIMAVSQPIVDEVATNLLLAPEIVQVEVQGHTDSQGSIGYNRDLSQRRVESVMAAMISRGISADRLTAVGFGEDCAIATNNTPAGRATNRRVQFFITDPTPTDSIPCHDGRPGQNSVETMRLERDVEVETPQ